MRLARVPRIVVLYFHVVAIKITYGSSRLCAGRFVKHCYPSRAHFTRACYSSRVEIRLDPGKDLGARYGKGSWVLVTGSSSGQGKRFALEFAKRGFNILLSGSVRNNAVASEIKKFYPTVTTDVVLVDFSDSLSDPQFFTLFEQALMDKDVSVLVNNVGHRTAWRPYHEMPSNKIGDTISVGTMPQARLCHMLIPKFLARTQKSAIINVTAQCVHKTYMFGLGMEPTMSVPHLSVYEAANAFGYFHSNSLLQEYGTDRFDILNITPGAVVTDNTDFLEDTWFAVAEDKFVQNVLRLLGNVQGPTSAYWGHALSEVLLNLVPFVKQPTLDKIGRRIAKDYMTHYAPSRHKYVVDPDPKQNGPVAASVRPKKSHMYVDGNRRV